MKDTEVAFIWIIKILQKHNIKFQITGGFAARIYGSKRPLADIDIDVPENNFQDILSDVKDNIIFGPKRYLDENWDLFLMTLKYKGQEIDICSHDVKMRKNKNDEWQRNVVDFAKFTEKKIYGIIVPIVLKDNLIKYKNILGREVDVEDIKQMSYENI